MTGGEVLIYVLLWLQPSQLPVYLSVWQGREACYAKAAILTRVLEHNGKPDHMVVCVQEALRDTTKEAP